MNDLYYIIIDLDGTLLWDFNSIDKETFDYLKYLKSLGHNISIAQEGRLDQVNLFMMKDLMIKLKCKLKLQLMKVKINLEV